MLNGQKCVIKGKITAPVIEQLKEVHTITGAILSILFEISSLAVSLISFKRVFCTNFNSFCSSFRVFGVFNNKKKRLEATMITDITM